jgi:hypothetical protein
MNVYVQLIGWVMLGFLMIAVSIFAMSSPQIVSQEPLMISYQNKVYRLEEVK